MSNVLLDTDVVSFLIKGDSRAALYQAHLQGNQLTISFMTVAELFQWAAVHQWGQRRIANLELSLQQYLVVPFHIGLCRRWGIVRAECQLQGKTISPQDAWIAATALYYQMPLITHNASDFTALPDLKVITEKST